MIREIIESKKGKVVDKWSSYIDTYETLFAPYKDRRINILEIGVANGGSLEVWAKYFQNATNIVGCDINPLCGELKYEDPRISVVVGDANETETLEKIKYLADDYDIIIDDGSHIVSDVVKSFSLYYRLLNYDSLYVVEDVHSSYWDGLGGGLHTPLSSMAFFKRIADIPNFEHWRIKRKRKDYLGCFEQFYHVEFDEEELGDINSVTFMNSMVIVRIKHPAYNKLGKRVIGGDDEHIMPNLIQSNGFDIKKLKVNTVDDWQYDPIAMINRINQLTNSYSEGKADDSRSDSD